MRRWLVLLTALTLGASASLAEDAPPFFRPGPSSAWPADIDSSLFFPVVLVGAGFDEGRRQAGSGVVIEGRVAEGRAWVLTCAHVVQSEGAAASTVRVGLLRHTYEDPARAAADYEEAIAAVVSTSVEHDLALLEVVVRGPLHDAPVGPRLREVYLGTPALVTLMPSLTPRVVTRTLHHYFVPGQSGSPLFEGGLVVGLAQGRGGGHGTTVGPRAIADFVARVPGGEPLVRRWEKLLQLYEELLEQRRGR